MKLIKKSFLIQSPFYLIMVLLMVAMTISSCNTVSKDEAPTIEGDIELSLNFSQFAPIYGPFWGQDVGFKGHALTNELFFAYSEIKKPSNDPATWDGKQVIIKYDLTNNTTKELRSKLLGSGSRYIHVIDDQIRIITTAGFGTLPIDLSQEPAWLPHNGNIITGFTRFGSVLYNGDIYIIGGDLSDNDPDGILSNKIRKWNWATSRFELFATMPGSKTYTSAEVVNDKLYVFGGQEQYDYTHDQIDPYPAQSSVFIYDFRTGSFETIDLPEPVSWTFTSVYNGLIFVSGQLLRDQPDPDQIADRDIFFQVFNPADNSFHEVDINLSDEGLNMIHDMTIIGDQLFVIYGIPEDHELDEEKPSLNWTIQRAIIDL